MNRGDGMRSGTGGVSRDLRAATDVHTGLFIMEYGRTINNPLLQTAISVGEATIRHACDLCSSLTIHIDLDQSPDGRDALRVTLRSRDAFSGFRMAIRNYFDHTALRRVAQHAWQRRIPCGTLPAHAPAHRGAMQASMN
jgi:hypothetical protein